MHKKHHIHEPLPLWAWLPILIMAGFITGAMLWTFLGQYDFDTMPMVAKNAPKQEQTLKTYTNDQYGFSFQYPGDLVDVDSFKFGDSHVKLALLTGKDFKNIGNPAFMEIVPMIRLELFDSSKSLLTKDGKSSNSASLLDYLKTEQSQKDVNGIILSYSEKKVNSQVWYKAEQPNIGGIDYYYTDFNGKIIDLAVDQSLNVDQILSTFQFTNSSAVSTADWKTYTNTDLGISFKYPSNFNVSKTKSSKTGEGYDILNDKNELIAIFGYAGGGIGEGDSNVASKDEIVTIGNNTVDVKTISYVKEKTIIAKIYFIGNSGLPFWQKKLDPETDQTINKILSTLQFTK